MGAVLPERPGRRACRAGVGVPGPAGDWAARDEGRGPGLLPVLPARRQARGPAGRGQDGAGEAAAAGEVGAVDGGALRDGLPRLLRLSPGGRDRPLVAFWVSAGARASELLSVTRSGADPGQQLITVIRKGSRAIQQLPASPDAFVWLRLYQQEVHGLVPAGPDDPLWWTLRRPFRPLTYDTARKMFDAAFPPAHRGLPPWPATRACRSPTCRHRYERITPARFSRISVWRTASCSLAWPRSASTEVHRVADPSLSASDWISSSVLKSTRQIRKSGSDERTTDIPMSLNPRVIESGSFHGSTLCCRPVIARGNFRR